MFKRLLSPTRWLIHGILLDRIEGLLFKQRVIKRYQDKANLNYKSILKNNSGLNKTLREERIIVSLTTIPTRIDKVPLVVACMMSQTLLPDKIVLNLDEKRREQYTISPELKLLQDRGLEIKFVRDIGPHTKYFHAIKENPNDIVVTVDDDIIYDNLLVETLFKSYKEFPNAISANIVVNYDLKKGEIVSSRKWAPQVRYGLGDKRAIAYGVGGVLYPPSILPKEAFYEEDIREYCLMADDIWLKAMEMLGKVNIVKAKNSDKLYRNLITVDGTQEIALSLTNDGQDKNVEYLRVLSQLYNIDLNK